MSSIASAVTGTGTTTVNKGTIIVLTAAVLLLIYADNAGVLAKIVAIVQAPPKDYFAPLTGGATGSGGSLGSLSIPSGSPTSGSSAGTTTVKIGGINVTVPTAPPLPTGPYVPTKVVPFAP